jgi:hypothetical protein
MQRITAGQGGRIAFTFYDYDGATELTDAEVTSLEYAIHDVTNDVVVRDWAAITPAASGYIVLESTDTALNATAGNTLEQRRVCLKANGGEVGTSLYYEVAAGECDSA